jgi:hypothetical protein
MLTRNQPFAPAGATVGRLTVPKEMRYRSELPSSLILPEEAIER